ncbi:chitin elicitor receptor kinase 1-like [Hevea brasiliensis]|uniref:chitin elicitor receptor kinase 1-like n=1 Tax=Hevea brasiliensis TaxID=3981 RepID=UPI0025E5E8A3|nr:chitin elicitor receptor kinase 1-like [Hevea brasiliensis]
MGSSDSVQAFIRINISFPCNCIKDEFLGHTFHCNIESGDTYASIVNKSYSNLTTINWLEQFNSYTATNISDDGVLNVTVSCLCGDSSISKDYGLFITYPLRAGDILESIARESNIATDMLRRYNIDVDFYAGTGFVYVPGKDTFISLS